MKRMEALLTRLSNRFDEVPELALAMIALPLALATVCILYLMKT